MSYDVKKALVIIAGFIIGYGSLSLFDATRDQSFVIGWTCAIAIEYIIKKVLK